MARQPRPPKDYDPLAMQRMLKDAADQGARPANREVPAPNRGAQDYRRSLYEGLFQ